jgi:hypothetical protein
MDNKHQKSNSKSQFLMAQILYNKAFRLAYKNVLKFENWSLSII